MFQQHSTVRRNVYCKGLLQFMMILIFSSSRSDLKGCQCALLSNILSTVTFWPQNTGREIAARCQETAFGHYRECSLCPLTQQTDATFRVKSFMIISHMAQVIGPGCTWLCDWSRLYVWRLPSPGGLLCCCFTLKARGSYCF